MDLEPLYLYILSKLPIRQIEEFERLREQAGSFKNAWQRAGLLEPVEKLAEKLNKESIGALPYYDPLYPTLLKQIFDPPPVLFYKGVLLDCDEACVGIVGTRMMSAYGKAVLPKITDPLIQSGCTIVSGLAYGVDAAAHQEAVKQKARTIAVLGSGLDDASLYPKHHVALAHEILEHNGLLLSEHPPGEPAFKQHFVARNRIIAGMSLSTVVVECKQKSGALITADYAMDFNRPVYAVPGPIYSEYSSGPHQLIQQGAMLITSGNEILEDLNLRITNSTQTNAANTPAELCVLECIQSSPRTIDEMLQLTSLSSGDLLAIISVLELNKQIKNLGAEGYIKTWRTIL